MAEYNYLLYKKSDELDYTIVKTLETPSFKRVELDPENAYDLITIDNKRNYPGLFNIEKSDKTVFFPPIRKVMCRIDTCDFCEQQKPVEDIHQEYTDLDNNMGYFYCNECRDTLMEGLKNTGVRPIWYIRERFEKDGYRISKVWIERTRRDDNGKSVDYGPYIFEKWDIIGWYATMIHDKLNNVMKPHVVCEGNGYIKSVPVDKILILNPEDNPAYNPNEDPKYK